MEQVDKKEDQLNDLLEDALSDLLEQNTDDGERGNVGPSGVEGVNEDEMNKFFEDMQMKLKTELPKFNESVPQIFDMMQNLLSKELLYPALKDLAPKFEEYLNKSTLSKEDAERFKKQKDIIDEIIQNFDDDSLDNHEKFEKNLDLMEKMQTLGSPPEELTVPGEGLGKCSIM